MSTETLLLIEKWKHLLKSESNANQTPWCWTQESRRSSSAPFSLEKILIWKILILQFQFVFDSPLPDTKDHIYKFANRCRQTKSYMFRFTNI